MRTTAPPRRRKADTPASDPGRRHGSSRPESVRPESVRLASVGPERVRAKAGRQKGEDPAPARAPQPPEAASQDTPATPSAEVLKQFRVIFRSVKKHFQVIERKCGIGGSQLWALGTISANPGIRVSDLARTLSIHQSTASNLVEQMVRLGLILRERDDEDQRVVRLRATARGAVLIERAPQPLTGVLPDALSNLAPADLQALRSSLARLLDVMQVRDESATHTPLADI